MFGVPVRSVGTRRSAYFRTQLRLSKPRAGHGCDPESRCRCPAFGVDLWVGPLAAKLGLDSTNLGGEFNPCGGWLVSPIVAGPPWKPPINLGLGGQLYWRPPRGAEKWTLNPGGGVGRRLFSSDSEPCEAICNQLWAPPQLRRRPSTEVSRNRAHRRTRQNLKTDERPAPHRSDLTRRMLDGVPARVGGLTSARRVPRPWDSPPPPPESDSERSARRRHSPRHALVPSSPLTALQRAGLLPDARRGFGADLCFRWRLDPE